MSDIWAQILTINLVYSSRSAMGFNGSQLGQIYTVHCIYIQYTWWACVALPLSPQTALHTNAGQNHLILWAYLLWARIAHSNSVSHSGVNPSNTAIFLTFWSYKASVGPGRGFCIVIFFYLSSLVCITDTHLDKQASHSYIPIIFFFQIFFQPEFTCCASVMHTWTSWPVTHISPLYFFSKNFFNLSSLVCITDAHLDKWASQSCAP